MIVKLLKFVMLVCAFAGFGELWEFGLLDLWNYESSMFGKFIVWDLLLVVTLDLGVFYVCPLRP